MKIRIFLRERLEFGMTMSLLSPILTPRSPRFKVLYLKTKSYIKEMEMEMSGSLRVRFLI